MNTKTGNATDDASTPARRTFTGNLLLMWRQISTYVVIAGVGAVKGWLSLSPEMQQQWVSNLPGMKEAAPFLFFVLFAIAKGIVQKHPELLPSVTDKDPP